MVSYTASYSAIFDENQQTSFRSDDCVVEAELYIGMYPGANEEQMIGFVTSLFAAAVPTGLLPNDAYHPRFRTSIENEGVSAVYLDEDVDVWKVTTEFCINPDIESYQGEIEERLSQAADDLVFQWTNSVNRQYERAAQANGIFPADIRFAPYFQNAPIVSMPVTAGIAV